MDDTMSREELLESELWLLALCWEAGWNLRWELVHCWVEGWRTSRERVRSRPAGNAATPAAQAAHVQVRVLLPVYADSCVASTDAAVLSGDIGTRRPIIRW